MLGIVRPMLAAAFVALVSGCGGGGDDGRPGPIATPADPPEVYSATLVEVRVDRIADQADLTLTGLPADGATLTVE